MHLGCEEMLGKCRNFPLPHQRVHLNLVVSLCLELRKQLHRKGEQEKDGQVPRGAPNHLNPEGDEVLL